MNLVDEKDRSHLESDVIELSLCEVPHIFLKPDTLYRFKVMEGCKECERLAKFADTRLA